MCNSTTTGIYGGKEKAIGIYQIDTLYQININKLFSDLKKEILIKMMGINPKLLRNQKFAKKHNVNTSQQLKRTAKNAESK